MKKIENKSKTDKQIAQIKVNKGIASTIERLVVKSGSRAGDGGFPLGR